MTDMSPLTIAEDAWLSFLDTDTAQSEKDARTLPSSKNAWIVGYLMAMADANVTWTKNGTDQTDVV